MKNEEKNIEEENYIDEEIYDNELLAESAAGNKNKLIYIFLGITFALAAMGIFYTLLKDAPPPVKVEAIKKTSVKSKEFRVAKPIERKTVETATLPVFPKMPKLPTAIKPKTYKPKLFKGGGGVLDISQKPVSAKETKAPQETMEEKSKSVVKAYTGGKSTRAGIHHYDANLFLPRGTLIPCSLDTRLISMVSGQITCTVAEDIYSASGNVLLIEKGSSSVGSYKSETLGNGMNRIYAIWDDIRTPNNVIISVGSQGADELGANGMVGEIDNHWAMRFGGAVLVSIIDDGLNMVASKHNNQNGLIISGTTSNANRMGELALKQYINIPPTLYKDHGDLITIFLNKDIDFSEVYGLER